MPVIATDTNRYSEVVKFEFEPSIGYTRESAVINDVAATLKVGTVLGKVTATGKYKVALSAAVDGSQTPVAILIADGNGVSNDLVVPANTDTRCLVLARGPALVADSALTLGTGITAAAARTALAALNPPVLVDTAL
jgi:Bacteriophage lambda head decoration protein D